MIYWEMSHISFSLCFLKYFKRDTFLEIIERTKKTNSLFEMQFVLLARFRFASLQRWHHKWLPLDIPSLVAGLLLQVYHMGYIILTSGFTGDFDTVMQCFSLLALSQPMQ